MNTYLETLLNKISGLTEMDKKALSDELLVKEFPKETILLRQGEVPEKCYYIFEGSIRQFFIDEQGNEKTTGFFLEEDTAAVLNPDEVHQPAQFFWQCPEDAVLLVGDLKTESEILNRYPEIQAVIREMLEKSLGKIQTSFAAFVSSSPEERVRNLLTTRPELFKRFPQHQVASFLGMTPESLSRIKKRLS